MVRDGKIAPDNIHVAWTSLNMACGAVNFIGKFKKLKIMEIFHMKLLTVK